MKQKPVFIKKIEKASTKNRILKIIFSFFVLTFVAYNTAFAYPFNPQTPTILGGDMHLVESADFNADGKNDLVITDGKAIRGIGILYGNGNGTFQAPLLLGDLDTYEWGLAVGDIDTDGDVDIVLGNTALKQIQIYKNTGTGSRFTGAFDVVAINDPNGSSRADLTLVDINNDNFLDILLSTQQTSIFEVYVNNGSGSFSYSSSGAGAFFTGLGSTAHDYTGDGWKDVIIADGNGFIRAYQNDGSGMFSALDYSLTINGPSDVKVADFNNDNVFELVIASNTDGLIVSSLDGTTNHVTYSGVASYIKVSDFDNDGNKDIIWSDDSVTGVQVALGNGDLTFNTPVAYAVSFAPLGVAVNDFDGDGLVDAAAVNHGDVLSIFLTATLPQTAGIWVNPTPLLANTSETGPVGTTFQIGLNSEPTDIVEISFVNNDNQVRLTKSGDPVTGVCFVPASMSTTPGVSPFEPCNTWNLGQEITVTPVVDGTPEGTHTGVIEFTVISSPDSNYATLPLPASLTTTIADENDTTAPSITSVTLSAPGGTTPDFTATMGVDNLTLEFVSDEFLDMANSIISIGGVTATCIAPSVITSPYICTVPASSLVANVIYGQSLNNIEIKAVDLSGNIQSPVVQTTDGTSVTVLPVVVPDTTAPTVVLTTGSTSVSGPFVVTINPSEPINGFSLSDIVVTNGTPSLLIGPDGSGNYTVTITPTGTSPVLVVIPSGSVTDNALNSQAVDSNTLSITYTVVPTKTKEKSGSKPKKQEPIVLLEKNCPHFTQHLQIGDRDGKKVTLKQEVGVSLIASEVAKFQSFLLDKGYNPGPIDGIFGNATKQAVIAFQSDTRPLDLVNVKTSNFEQILKPWNMTFGSGKIYQSTERWANIIAGCQDEVVLDNGTVLK